MLGFLHLAASLAEELYDAGALKSCLLLLEEREPAARQSPELLLLRALCLIRLGRPSEARAALAGPRQEAGLTAAMRLEAGQAYEAQGEDAAALEQYDRATRLDPDDREPRARRARLLQKLGRREEALAVLDAALGRAPGDAGLTLLKIAFLVEDGRTDEAWGWARVARPDAAVRAAEILFFRRHLLRLRTAQQSLNEGDWAQALRICEEVLAVEPGSAAALSLAALCQVEAGRPELAEAALQAALRLAPGEPTPRRCLPMMRGLPATPRLLEGRRELSRAAALEASWAPARSGS